MVEFECGGWSWRISFMTYSCIIKVSTKVPTPTLSALSAHPTTLSVANSHHQLDMLLIRS